MGGLGSKTEEPHFDLEPSYVVYCLRGMLVGGGHYGLPGTNGTLFSNYFARLKNEHSVISMFAANLASPFDHHERAIFLFCSLSYVFFVTICLSTLSVKNPAAQSVVVILISTSLIVPFKKLVRTMMECGFLFKQGDYNPKKVHESYSERYNMDSEYSKQGCVTICGHCITTCIFCGATSMLVIGLVWALTQDRYEGFVGDWVYTQFITVLFSEPGMEFATFMYMWKFKDPKGEFEKKWGKYYRPDLGEAMPLSMTDVGLKAKAIYIKHNGEKGFAMIYGFGSNIQYDRWLAITNQVYNLPQYELEKIHGASSTPQAQQQVQGQVMMGQTMGTPQQQVPMQSLAYPNQIVSVQVSDAQKQAAFTEINNLRQQANLKPLTFEEWNVAV